MSQFEQVVENKNNVHEEMKCLRGRCACGGKVVNTFEKVNGKSGKRAMFWCKEDQGS